MNENVQSLSKKHGQLKQAITRMIQEIIGFLEDIVDLKTKMEVIECIRIVTEGKVSNLIRNTKKDIMMIIGR